MTKKERFLDRANSIIRDYIMYAGAEYVRNQWMLKTPAQYMATCLNKDFDDKLLQRVFDDTEDLYTLSMTYADSCIVTTLVDGFYITEWQLSAIVRTIRACYKEDDIVEAVFMQLCKAARNVYVLDQ